MPIIPGGHAEGYPDTHKQLYRRFYASISDPALTPDYPQFADGLRQMKILDAEMASHKSRAWVDVPGVKAVLFLLLGIGAAAGRAFIIPRMGVWRAHATE